MAKKLTAAASIAGILGTAIALYSTFVVSNEQPKVQQQIDGTKHTIIGENSGTLNITYNEPSTNSNSLVLSRSVPVFSEPDLLNVIQDKSKQVCPSATAGLSVTLTGKQHTESSSHHWKQIKLNGGSCSGKIGWVLDNALAYR